MKIQSQQIKGIHALLPTEIKADKELKEEFIFQHTRDMARTSTRDLTYKEAQAILKALNENNPMTALEAKKNRMRRKIFSLMVHQVGYTKEQMLLWCKEKGKFRKPLNDHSYEELVQLVTQAEIVYKKHLKALKT